MSVESLTYVELAHRLGCSQEAARSLSRRLRLSRRPGNDGRVRITVDLTEIQYKPLPARSPTGHRCSIDGLNVQIERLEGELARLEVERQCLEFRSAGHRADFEYERKRGDTLVTETLKLNELAMSAREKAARLEGELSTALTRHRWWSRAAQGSRRNPVLVGVPIRI
jgi:hypothetical protein